MYKVSVFQKMYLHLNQITQITFTSITILNYIWCPTTIETTLSPKRWKRRQSHNFSHEITIDFVFPKPQEKTLKYVIISKNLTDKMFVCAKIESMELLGGSVA